MLLVVALLSVGCASTGKAVATLEPGMTKQQVLDALGPRLTVRFAEVTKLGSTKR
jgi:outer membrane protein assembly factor BamE (lipoprotein component of BamABCDE complex)